MTRKLDIELAIRIYKETGNMSESARACGYSREYIRQVFEKLGITKKSISNIKMQKAIEYIESLEGGVCPLVPRELREKFGLNYEQYSTLRKTIPIKFKHVIVPKYSDYVIIEMYKECGGNYSRMARKMGTKQSCVSRLFRDRGLRDKYPPKGRQEVF